MRSASKRVNRTRGTTNANNLDRYYIEAVGRKLLCSTLDQRGRSQTEMHRTAKEQSACEHLQRMKHTPLQAFLRSASMAVRPSHQHRLRGPLHSWLHRQQWEEPVRLVRLVVPRVSMKLWPWICCGGVAHKTRNRSSLGDQTRDAYGKAVKHVSSRKGLAVCSV